MKQQYVRTISSAIIFMYLFTLFLIPAGKLHAETDFNTLEDGSYTIDYVILHAQTDSVSIANDYFEKPATLFVENGEKYIQFSLNHSQWTKELQAPLGDTFVDVDVISEDEVEDVRLVEFKLDRDLMEPLEFKMHVLIETMDPVYDHRYTVRFDFDPTSIALTDNPVQRSEQNTDESNAEADVKGQEEAAPVEKQTDGSDEAAKESGISITMVVIMAAALILVIFAVSRKLVTKK